MILPNNFEARFQGVMETLLETTDASRTTLRLDLPEINVTVDTIIAEATAHGAISLKGSKSITDLRNTVAPVKYLAEHLKILVQDDCLNATPAPPPSLIEHYGVKAQMLGPVIENGSLIGVISVHYNLGVRHWSEQDVEHLRQAMAQISDILSISAS